MIFECLVAPSTHEVLREWLKPQAAFFTNADRATSPPPRQGDARPDFLTPVNTLSTGTSVHAMAWVGDMPLVPRDLESDHLAQGMKLFAGTAVWMPKR